MWGHGFVARVDRRNQNGIGAALVHPRQPSLEGQLLDLPWAVIDAAECGRAPVVDSLRAHGTKMIFDTAAYRFREPPTWTIPKYRDLPWTPPAALHDGDLAALRLHSRRDLVHQAQLQADAYLVPGFVPRDRTDDVRGMTLAAVEAALEALGSPTVPARPLIGFVGVHASNPDAGLRIVRELSQAVGGIFVQFTPVDPRQDGTPKLRRVAELLLECEAVGFPVIAGRLGGIGTLLRALGISAAEAGLATGEAFDLRNQLRLPRQSERRRPFGSGTRVFVAQLGQAVAGGEWRRLMQAENLWGTLRCSLPCCRFQSIDSTLQRAAQHNLWCRTSEAAKLAAVAAPLRPQHALDLLGGQRSVLDACNRALVELGEPTIRPGLLEHQLTTLKAFLMRGPRAA